MNFNAPIPAWVVLLMVIVLTALVLYFAFVAHRNGTAADLTIERLAHQRDKAIGELDAAQQHITILEDANKHILLQYENLHAQLADRNEALQEAMAENKALQMNTIEVQEVAPEPVKRTRKKAETKQ